MTRNPTRALFIVFLCVGSVTVETGTVLPAGISGGQTPRKAGGVRGRVKRRTYWFLLVLVLALLVLRFLRFLP